MASGPLAPRSAGLLFVIPAPRFVLCAARRHNPVYAHEPFAQFDRSGPQSAKRANAAGITGASDPLRMQRLVSAGAASVIFSLRAGPREARLSARAAESRRLFRP